MRTLMLNNLKDSTRTGLIAFLVALAVAFSIIGGVTMTILAAIAGNWVGAALVLSLCIAIAAGAITWASVEFRW